MSDPWQPPSDQPASPPPDGDPQGGEPRPAVNYYASPVPYGWPQVAYGAPPPGASGYGYGGYAGGGYGPPGRVRPTGISIVLFVCTLSIYGYVYNFQVHDEMKRHSGRGIGGGVALLLTFLANIAMPFVTPAEVGALYERRGERPPVNGWTGLWVIVPVVGSYIVLFIGLIVSLSQTNTSGHSGSGLTAVSVVGLVLVAVVFIVLIVGGPVIWFVKTNGALTRYWQSVGVS